MSDEILEELLTFTYSPARLTFQCPDCGMPVEITRHSVGSVMSGVFCIGCNEQYYIRWNDGIVKKGTIDHGRQTKDIDTEGHAPQGE